MSASKRDVPRTTIDRRSLLRAAGLGGGSLLAMTAAGRCARGLVPSAGAAPAAQEKTTITFWTPGGGSVFCGGFETI